MGRATRWRIFVILDDFKPFKFIFLVNFVIGRCRISNILLLLRIKDESFLIPTLRSVKCWWIWTRYFLFIESSTLNVWFLNEQGIIGISIWWLLFLPAYNRSMNGIWMRLHLLLSWFLIKSLVLAHWWASFGVFWFILFDRRWFQQALVDICVCKTINYILWSSGHVILLCLSDIWWCIWYCLSFDN